MACGRVRSKTMGPHGKTGLPSCGFAADNLGTGHFRVGPAPLKNRPLVLS
jgi:hypothetical protein